MIFLLKDFLPPFDKVFNGKVSLFISDNDELEMYDWVLFFGPLTYNTWLMVLIIAILITISALGIECLHSDKYRVNINSFDRLLISKFNFIMPLKYRYQFQK